MTQMKKDNMETKVINFFAGPGAGKSSVSSHLFSLLKHEGRNVELVTEFAKDIVWEESFKVLKDQVYLFGTQYHRLWRLLGKVEYIITDSPLLLNLWYGKDMPHSFSELVLDLYKEMDNINIFLHRTKPYNPNGRMQTEQEAKEYDVHIKQLLNIHNIPMIDIVSDQFAADKIKSILKES